MHLVVDSNWAKAHPRRAAKIQVEYLLMLARRKDRSCPARSSASEDGVARVRRQVATEAVDGP